MLMKMSNRVRQLTAGIAKDRSDDNFPTVNRKMLKTRPDKIEDKALMAPIWSRHDEGVEK